MQTKTVVYYTANREDPVFEQKIMDNILANKGDLPLISVSQKPIDFGENICVGDVGCSYQNEFRQIYVGAKAATTPYLVFCESDFLYPPDYFQFDPPDENECYEHDNVWMVWKDTDKGYMHKTYSEGAQICGRELFIQKFEEFYKDFPEWSIGKPPKRKGPLTKYPWKWFGGSPCVSFKTGRGMSWAAKTRDVPEEHTLPYWGSIESLKQTYL